VDISTKDKVYLKLVKGINNRYKILNNFIKLLFIKARLYLVKAIILPLLYKLELPD
jgi:F0F1-type ATP synthase delta subunit